MTSESLYTMYNENAKSLKSVLREKFGETENLVDTIITSPPYADLQNYGDQDDQIGEQDYEQFLDDLKDIFEQCYEVATEDATLWIITDTFKRHNRLVRLPTDIADEIENFTGLTECSSCPECDGMLMKLRDKGVFLCEDCGEQHDPREESWRLEDHLIWDKERTRPWRRKGQLRNVYEHISMYSKSDDFTYNINKIRITDPEDFGRWWVDYPERYNPKGKVPDNIWRFPIPKQGQWGPKLNYHPSPFPKALVERILKLSTEPGDVVLDPFGGVGTTLAVAEELDRKPIGFELNPEFIEYYEQYVRPQQTTLPSVESERSAQRDTERKIWMLRIHKYAFEIYRELTGAHKDTKQSAVPYQNLTNIAEDVDKPKRDRNDGIYPEDIKTILVNADEQTIPPKDVERPTGKYVFLHKPGVALDAADFEDAITGLKSEERGSGDYYELDFEFQGYSVSDYASECLNQIDSTETLYVYTGGAHHQYGGSLSANDWATALQDGKEFYQSNNWPPLISNLKINIENPLETSERGEVEPEQTDLIQFGDDP